MAPGAVDQQDEKEEQAQEGQYDQNEVRDSGSHSGCIPVHYATSFLAALARFFFFLLLLR